MDAEAAAPLIHGHGSGWDLRSTFGSSVAALSGALFVLVAALTEYSPEAKNPAHVDRYYSFLTDVLVMVRAACGRPRDSRGPGFGRTARAARSPAAAPTPAHCRRRRHRQIFLGFGFLMTFLKRYSYSAVALNYAASCLVMLEAVLLVGWAQQGLGVVSIDLPLVRAVCEQGRVHRTPAPGGDAARTYCLASHSREPLGFCALSRARCPRAGARLPRRPQIIDCAFCAGAAMISFGAVLGRATPAQLVWLLALEVLPYAAVAQLVAGYWDALDGGHVRARARVCVCV
jgi:ammonium transporter Rh